MTTSSPRDARVLLILAAVITLIAWQFPIGRTILYPFTLLATYAHEMGHGLTAILVGADFDGLDLYANGSGFARWSGDVGRIGRAAIAAGGLVGPSIAGATILAISRRPSRAPAILIALGVSMGVSAVFAADTLFAAAFILAWSAAFILVARYLALSFAPFFVQLVGVQLCLAVFRDVRYMFSDGAIVGGAQHLSDSAAIADALFLPYWFWGALVAAFSFGVLTAGLVLALRGQKQPSPVI